MRDGDNYLTCLIHRTKHVERVLEVKTARSDIQTALNVVENYERLHGVEVDLVACVVRPSDSQNLLRLLASYYPVRLLTEWELAELKLHNVIEAVTVENVARSAMLRGMSE